jgi:hypothetical protein
MPKFICDTNDMVDWDEFIATIEQQGEVVPNFLFDTSKTVEENLILELPEENFLPTDKRESISEIVKAPFDWTLVNWTDYCLGFSPVVRKISSYLNVKVLRAFATKVDSNICVPIHWDIGDVRFRTKNNLTRMVRYICFIHDTFPGQTFCVDQHCFHNEKQGSLYEWDHYTDFHSTFNGSDQPHYLFHLLGEKDED